MNSMWVLRGILVALSLALAVFLVLRGNVVIGVLVGAMAVARVGLFVQMKHRRDRFRRRIEARRGRGPSQSLGQ